MTFQRTVVAKNSCLEQTLLFKTCYLNRNYFKISKKLILSRCIFCKSEGFRTWFIMGIIKNWLYFLYHTRNFFYIANFFPCGSKNWNRFRLDRFGSVRRTKTPTPPGGLDEVPNMVMGRTVGQRICFVVIISDDLTFSQELKSRTHELLLIAIYSSRVFFHFPIGRVFPHPPQFSVLNFPFR